MCSVKKLKAGVTGTVLFTSCFSFRNEKSETIQIGFLSIKRVLDSVGDNRSITNLTPQYCGVPEMRAAPLTDSV